MAKKKCIKFLCCNLFQEINKLNIYFNNVSRLQLTNDISKVYNTIKMKCKIKPFNKNNYILWQNVSLLYVFIKLWSKCKIYRNPILTTDPLIKKLINTVIVHINFCVKNVIIIENYVYYKLFDLWIGLMAKQNEDGSKSNRYSAYHLH